MHAPLISIITVVYNDKDRIEKTIQSSINQTYANKEIIIVDGKSTDNTLSIIHKYDNQLAKIISEPDKGIYDAMNKGINLASGDWLIFMNAGDSFYNDKVLDDFFLDHDMTTYEFIYGKVNIFSDSLKKNWILGKKVSFKDLYFSMPICHQSIFFSKSSFLDIGLYDTNYKVSADHEWVTRYFKKNETTYIKYMNKVIANHEMDGFSLTNLSVGIKDRKKIAKAYFPTIIYLFHLLKYPFLKLKTNFIKVLFNTKIFKVYRKVKYS